MKSSLLTYVALVLAAHLVAAQSRNTEHTLRLDEGAASPPAAIEDLAWLAGSWRGDGFGGQFEDVWSRASAGTMMGMFKVINDGAPSFYELQLIVEREGTLAWWVKHFTAGFEAWEERAEFVTFPLVRLTEDTAYFSGLTLRRISADELQVFLALGQGDGTAEAELRYYRDGAGPAVDP